MSRIIVKNLPKQIKEDRLKKLFATHGGQITDIQLKYSKDGVFRQFAFVGFKEDNDASKAVEYFNNTFLDTSRLKVEITAELGDAEKKPRAWSKYSKDSSKYLKKNSSEILVKNDKKSDKKKKEKPDDLLNNLENDPEFKEFMEVHRKVDDQQIWGNDEVGKIKEEEEDEASKSEDDDDEAVVGNKISDLEYLKSKRVNKERIDDATNEKNLADVPKKKQQKVDPESGFTVKLKNLPYKAKKKEIKEFFSPHKPTSLRMPRKVKGIAYALFKTEKGFKAALNKHRSIIGGHRIDVVKYANKEPAQEVEKVVVKKKPWEQDKDKTVSSEDLETVAESGRLFVRNLAYSCTEDDLETLFKPFGPLSEVNLPIDKFTRKVKGFAFITYMIPEHAVKACAELDGGSFQGRLLHLLPSKIKESKEENESGGSSYKKKLNSQQKASSSSAHNWNSLFLGANAVTEVMSDKYNTSKSQILDSETPGSMAVRVALGETQIVNETREFLIKHGVNLDEFSQPASERSKVVIIAKNLPSGTSTNELKTLFSKHGVVKSVLFPPSGITAIIEMEEPSEARAAFRKLAYSKFHYMPLYLEWAPMKVFKEDRKQPDEVKTVSEVEKMEEEEEIVEEDPDPDANVFVKNLNFSTTEDDLCEHFKKIGKLHSAIIMKKKKLKDDGDSSNLSMGYGFVHFMEKEDAMKAIKELQHSELDEHVIELKLSNRATQSVKMNAERKKAVVTKQKSSKILVRNVPFEAKKKEIEELFKVFGELRAVRLPKKVTGSHRGFAFIDFLSKNDAKRAFGALCHSTHLYGRRLVLEWAEPEEDVNSIRKKTAQHFFEGGSAKKRSRKAIVDQTELIRSGKHNKSDLSDGDQDQDTEYL